MSSPSDHENDPKDQEEESNKTPNPTRKGPTIGKPPKEEETDEYPTEEEDEDIFKDEQDPETVDDEDDYPEGQDKVQVSARDKFRFTENSSNMLLVVQNTKKDTPSIKQVNQCIKDATNQRDRRFNRRTASDQPKKAQEKNYNAKY